MKDVPRLVDIGKKLNPNITWYYEDDYLNRQYDLIIVNGVLQYVVDLRKILTKIDQSVDGCLFFGYVPVVTKREGFVMLQRCTIQKSFIIKLI